MDDATSPIVQCNPTVCVLNPRCAQPEDVPAINALVARSVRAVHTGHYDEPVIKAAIQHAYGVDWQLVRDGSYFIVELDGALAGAGGWSWRETIAGAHGPDDPPGAPLDPTRDTARIRAFYVDPAFARRGVGASLLAISEGAARKAGFARAALTSTLPAVRFYSAHGYREMSKFVLPLPGGLSLDLVLMEKSLDDGD